MYRIESLLSARLFLSPQLANDHIYFISNLSGHMSLYRMDYGGAEQEVPSPEPLLPPHISLQNPTLMNGQSFQVFPKLGKVLVMIDNDGDEAYQPMMIPLEGGYPEPIFEDIFKDHQVNLIHTESDTNTVWFWASSRVEPMNRSYRANLETADGSVGGEIVKLDESMYGGFPIGATEDYSKTIVGDGYGAGDIVIFLREEGVEGKKLVYGVPLSERQPGQQVPPNSIGECHFVNDDKGLLFFNSIFSDTYGVAYMDLADPKPQPVTIIGEQHTGLGVLEEVRYVEGDRFLISYNIDGCAWFYEATFHFATLTLVLGRVLVGQGDLAGGVLKGFSYDKASDCYVFSFTTATTPPQIYSLEGPDRTLKQHTRERVLGIPDGLLSAGEDASFTSFDGLRISARLYLPHESLGYEGKRPVVYYIHGGPQSQEHPDFSWFSMPLIQQLTLNGFAVFVPNVRGSTGYGFDYMKRVVKDWGGQDRLDHVHAMTEVLPRDGRLDLSRAGVVGRSYGGYMTLTLAGRHPELWSAACDMFGPYDLMTFASR
ncbi:MAG: alpha/beta fold hydrolase, partial [Anaerolineae bacterium]|nr:alpha/beta fold hydrolase [Anaerolineae bacterium]